MVEKTAVKVEQSTSFMLIMTVKLPFPETNSSTTALLTVVQYMSMEDTPTHGVNSLS